MSFPTRTLLIAFVTLLLLTVAAPEAKADFYTVTNISYNGTLAGFSSTFRDGIEDGYDLECYPYSGYCAVWFYSHWLTVDAELYAPTAGLVGVVGSAGILEANAGFVGPVNEYGTWSQWGHHGIFRDVYYSECYLWNGEVYCYGWTPMGTEGGYVGSTTGSVYVPPPQPVAPEITFVDWSTPDVWVTVQQDGCYGLVFDSAVPAIDFEYASDTGLSGSVSGWTHTDQACVSHTSPWQWFTTWRIVSAKATAGVQPLVFGAYGPAITIHDPPPPPEVYYINPTGSARNSTGSFTITGNRLANASMQSCDSGQVELSAVSSTRTTASANYTIRQDAPLGECPIYVITGGGEAGINFMIGDETPVITSISPSTGDAGTSPVVTISGTGFGSSPTLNVSLPYSMLSRSSTHFQAVFNLTSADMGDYVVSITSHGANGMGFIAPIPGAPQRSNEVTFRVLPPPVPPVIQVWTDNVLVTTQQSRIKAEGSDGHAAMPTLKAKLVGNNLPNGTVAWWAEFKHNRPESTATQWSHRFPASGTRNKQIGEEWDITAEMGGSLRGGTVTVHANYYFPFEFTFTFVVGGDNPSHQQIRDYLGTTPWFLQRLVRNESDYRQFAGDNLPLFGKRDGWGLMQTDPPPHADVVWDWQKNADAGKLEVTAKREDSSHTYGAYTRYQDDIDRMRLHNTNPSNVNNKITMQGPVNYSSVCQFEMGGTIDNPSVTPPSGKQSFGDANWIRNYNGHYQMNMFSGMFIALNTTSSLPKPQWEINDSNPDGVNYVSRVCNKTP